MTLHELARISGNDSDKQNQDHSFAGQNYLHYYERHFELQREQPLTVLEIGVFCGLSVQLWRDYFPKAHVHGLDINPNTRRDFGERITIHIGNQGDPADLKRMLEAAGGHFDIVVDDGSHIVEHMLTSLIALWPHIASGGFYCIEDLRCAYHGADGNWPGMKYNPPGTNFNNDRRKMDAVLLNTIHTLDQCQGDVRSLHCYPMVMILEKV